MVNEGLRGAPFQSPPPGLPHQGGGVASRSRLAISQDHLPGTSPLMGEDGRGCGEPRNYPAYPPSQNLLYSSPISPRERPAGDQWRGEPVVGGRLPMGSGVGRPATSDQLGAAVSVQKSGLRSGCRFSHKNLIRGDCRSGVRSITGSHRAGRGFSLSKHSLATAMRLANSP